MIERNPNHTSESEIAAEQSVLGILLYIESKDNPPCGILEIISVLENRYFSQRHHKIIFETIRLMSEKQKPIDILTVIDVLEQNGQSEDVGGIGYLADLVKNCGSIYNVAEYIYILKDASDRRAFNLILRTALTESTDDLLADVNKTTSEIEAIRKRMLDLQEGLIHFKDLDGDWIEAYEERFKGMESPYINTGIESVDAIIAPAYIPLGSLVVVGARPKMGKTQFTIKLAENIAMNLQRGVATFSLEMTSDQLIERMIGMHSGVPYDFFYETEKDVQEMTSDEASQFNERRKRVYDSIAMYEQTNCYISDDTDSSISRVEAESRRIHRYSPLSAIVVDYLTLMPKGEAERNDLAYAEITRRLKLLAKELNCVVFLVTQLNRQLEQRQDKRPLPSDSRDTGQIEQDCDLWIGLYRDSFYNTNSEYPTDVVEVLIRLNRHGDTGTALCRMNQGSIESYTGKPIKQRSFKDTMASIKKHQKDD